MKPVPYLLVQDRLPAGGSLSRRDAVADGLPTRYASRGSADLSGRSAAELVGKTWLDSACGADILEHGPTCRYLTQVSGLPADEAAVGLRRPAQDAEVGGGFRAPAAGRRGLRAGCLRAPARREEGREALPLRVCAAIADAAVAAAAA
eukprot:CAMPEP_0179343400 /NCGR_PEP_ID=MMETSP0797-20121207/70945_1 /TAXON_ID=47934 /ORGANISM="Dinophysis acuminata, Strain DAEP01" /LENGTH=147 /DNA_ID=CAMNT_0021057729 /DNA_START=103 /DNA_END=544 /DNA_ORIENTATION=+